MSSHYCSQMSKVLIEFLEAEAEELARASGFVERTSKLNGRNFAQTVIMGWLGNADASLNELVQWAGRLGVKISEAGLQQRLNDQAVSFLGRLLERGLKTLQGQDSPAVALLTRFESVYLLDSSLITLPAHLSSLYAGSGLQGCASAVKVQLSYEYRRGRIGGLEVVAGRSPDQNCLLHLANAEPGSLHLFDLGYFKQATFQALAQANAYFISRLQSQTALYQCAEDKHALHLVKLLKSQSTQHGEISLYLGCSTRLPIRLIFQKLPPQVIEQRLRKAKAKARKHGKTCSERHLALLHYALFITNVPADWLMPDQILQVYRLRWQIELIFKLWKSHAHLDHVQPWRPQRILCQFLARLLGLVLFHAIVAPWRFAQSVELSLPKAFRIFRRYCFSLAHALAAQCPDPLTHLLLCLVEDFLRFARTSSRKKSPSTFRSLAALVP